MTKVQHSISDDAGTIFEECRLSSHGATVLPIHPRNVGGPFTTGRAEHRLSSDEPLSYSPMMSRSLATQRTRGENKKTMSRVLVEESSRINGAATSWPCVLSEFDVRASPSGRKLVFRDDGGGFNIGDVVHDNARGTVRVPGAKKEVFVQEQNVLIVKPLPNRSAEGSPKCHNDLP